MKSVFLLLAMLCFSSVCFADAVATLTGSTSTCPNTDERYEFHTDNSHTRNLSILLNDFGYIKEYGINGSVIARPGNTTTKQIDIPLGDSDYTSTGYVIVHWGSFRGNTGTVHFAAYTPRILSNTTSSADLNVVIGSPDISGTVQIEASCDLAEQGVTIPSVPGATSYTWQNTLGWTLTGTYEYGGRTSAYFKGNTANTSGQITVTVNNSGCPATNSTRTFLVNRSTPAAFINGPDNLAGGNYDNYNAATGGNNYTWSVPTGWSIYSGQGTATINVQAPNYDSIGSLYVTFTNLCGQSETGTKRITSTLSQPGPSGPATQDATAGGATTDDTSSPKKAADTQSTGELTFYPNPATDEVHINLSGSGKAIIYDAKGGIVRSIDFAPQSVSNSINTMSLSNGLYHVCLFQNGAKVMDKQLMIKH